MSDGLFSEGWGRSTPRFNRKRTVGSGGNSRRTGAPEPGGGTTQSHWRRSFGFKESNCMHFEGDAFISYAHMDDVELIEGRKGWVANLHRALAGRVGQLLGEQPQIWRDPKLQGNDLFAETLVEQLRRVALLISIVSPRYVRSEWTRRELTEFWNAAEQQGGIRFHERARIFK